MSLLSTVVLISLLAFSSALEVSISFNETPFLIDFSLQNTQARSIHVLKYDTPLDEYNFGSAFTVTRDGQSVDYIGMLARRKIVPSSYLEIKANETLFLTVDLSKAYDFTSKGLYNVQVDMEVHFLQFINTENIQVARLQSNALSFEFVPAISGMTRNAESEENLGITYQSCTSSQQTTVNSAWSHFTTLSNKMSTYMKANQATAVYTTWFGSTTQYWSTVAQIVANEVTTRNGGNVRFNCNPPDGCASDPNIYAYVYPSDSTKTIYLCGAFWTSPNTGYDSKAGTIVHEISHFTSVGGTQDYAYGQSACKSLAKSNPKNASKNADNYTYFSESL